MCFGPARLDELDRFVVRFVSHEPCHTVSFPRIHACDTTKSDGTDALTVLESRVDTGLGNDPSGQKTSSASHTRCVSLMLECERSPSLSIWTTEDDRAVGIEHDLAVVPLVEVRPAGSKLM